MKTAIIVMEFIMCVLVTGMSMTLGVMTIKEIIDDWREGR
jgi:hypothetical protein